MTFSIIAYDTNTDTIAVAAATGNLLVGQFVPHCIHGVGAVASQGRTPNPTLVWQCLQQLANNADLQDFQQAIGCTITDNRLNQGAQITVMNRHGQSWGYTGIDNLPEKGILIDDHVAISGNWLRHDGVLPAMLNAYQQNIARPLFDRLISCLTSADEIGGDSRGLFSAAIKMDDGNHFPIDLRVDYSQTPITDLQTLYQKTQSSTYQQFLRSLPKQTNAPLKRLLKGNP